MKKTELKAIALKGEDSRLQFKSDVRNVDALASEMVAFSNSEGGRILIGVTDTGKLDGIPRANVGRINQLISNAASQHVRSPISPLTENVVVGNGLYRSSSSKRFVILFTATVHRKAKTSSRKMAALPGGLGKTSVKASGKTSGKILAAFLQDVNLTIPELASLIGVTERSIERNIKKLQEQRRLHRVGAAKGSHWVVIG